MSVQSSATRVLLCALLLPAAEAQWSPPYEYPYPDAPPPSLYRERRQRVLQFLGPRSLLLVFAAERQPRTGDVYYPYRQSSWLWYLSGALEPNAVLLLSRAGIQLSNRSVQELLFVPERDPRHELWEGARMGPAEAESLLHIPALPRACLDSLLGHLLQTVDTIYLLAPQLSPLRLPLSGGILSPEKREREWLRERFPHVVFRRGFPPLVQLRARKDTAELRLLRRAIAITQEAITALWRTVRPGMTERELSVLLESEVQRRGADGTAFPTIVASGAHACILHSTSRNHTIADGELVLVDCGAEYAGYAADITRTFPISGRFTPEQRILYAVVLEAQDSALAACKPGVPFRLPHTRAQDVLRRRLRELGILQREEDLQHYFPHATSHHVGLDVHDVGPLDTLRPGYLITVEPGLYIPPGSPCDQRWWGLGIRIEDVVHITDTGAELLSAALPRRVEELEAHLQKPWR